MKIIMSEKQKQILILYDFKYRIDYPTEHKDIFRKRCIFQKTQIIWKNRYFVF